MIDMVAMVLAARSGLTGAETLVVLAVIAICVVGYFFFCTHELVKEEPLAPGTLLRPEFGVINTVGEGAGMIQYVSHPRTKHTPSRLVVQLPCAVAGEFEVTRERLEDRFWKWIGLVREIQTGDAEFDREFFLASDQVGFARAAFASAQVREAIRSLGAVRVRRVVLEQGRLQATVTPFHVEDDWTQELVPQIALSLAAIVAALPRDHVEPRMLGLAAGKARRLAVRVIASAAFCLSLTATPAVVVVYSVLDFEKLVWPASIAGLVAWAGFLGAAHLFVRGGSRSYQGFLLNASLALVGFVVGAIHFALGLNAWLDHTPPRPHTVVILNYRMHQNEYRSGRGGRTQTSVPLYYLDVRSWRPGRNEETVMVTLPIFQAAERGVKRVVVHTTPGGLGAERMHAVTLAAP